jgi:hypothetical protein
MTWITRTQKRLSDRVHANGDAFAQQTGWTTTHTAGRFGFGARVYRDPRFSQPQPELQAAAQPGRAAETPNAVHPYQPTLAAGPKTTNHTQGRS